jgi:large subunit ribosomal protein L29
MKTKEVKELSKAELEERIGAAKTDLNRMKLQHSVSPVENTSLIGKTRKDIARMLTVLKSK